MKKHSIVAVTTGILLSLGITGCSKKNTVWIYTSIYKEVIAEMEPMVKKEFPDADIQWFQGGSENVAAKVNAEIAAGKAKADLILTSDPFWYLELKKAGKLLPYESPAAKAVPAQFKDADNAFTTVRINSMVIGYHSDAIKADEAPKSWQDLRQAKWKDKVSMGSPLESGTMFTAVALLFKNYGWGFFKDLRKQDLIAAGGNSSVITRIETKERPVGVVLLENILAAQKKGSPVRAVYPSDGVIPIASPIAILKDSEQAETAKKIYDWFFTDIAQKAIVKGGMHSPLSHISAPEGAKEWKEIEQSLMKWNASILEDIYSQRDQIKAKFSEVVLH